MSIQRIVLNKNANTKSHIIFGSIYITFWNNEIMGKESQLAARGQREGGWERNQCGVRANKELLQWRKCSSVCWLCQVTLFYKMSPVTIGGNWVKGTRELSVLFCIVVYKSTTVSK